MTSKSCCSQGWKMGEIVPQKKKTLGKNGLWELPCVVSQWATSFVAFHHTSPEEPQCWSFQADLQQNKEPLTLIKTIILQLFCRTSAPRSWASFALFSFAYVCQFQKKSFSASLLSHDCKQPIEDYIKKYLTLTLLDTLKPPKVSSNICCIYSMVQLHKLCKHWILKPPEMLIISVNAV